MKFSNYVELQEFVEKELFPTSYKDMYEIYTGGASYNFCVITSKGSYLLKLLQNKEAFLRIKALNQVSGTLHKTEVEDFQNYKMLLITYFDGHKLAGILINSTIKADLMDVSVVGIGLNVNQMRFLDWPTHPISMKMILGKDVALEPLLKQLVNAVDRRIQQLRSLEGIAKIKEDYLHRLYRYHEWGDFETKDGIVKLYVDGIDEFGRLKTLDSVGRCQVYDIKEIKFL